MFSGKVIILCLCLATAKGIVLPECKPVKTLIICDLKNDVNSRQLLAWMVEVIVQLYAKLPNSSSVKVVVYGERSKEFASALISSNKSLGVTLGDLISTTSLEKEITSHFTPSIFRHPAEIVYLLTINNKEYKLPNILKLKKKLTVIKFGNGGDMEYFKWASSPTHVVHIDNNVTEATNKNILDLTCKDSQYECDKDQFTEGKSIRCRDCGYICSRTVFRASCTAQCPYLKYAEDVAEDSAQDEAGEEIRYKTEDNKYVVIGATIGSIVVIILLIVLVALLLYKKGYFLWLTNKCRSQGGAPTQQAGADTRPVQETDQPANNETEATQPLLIEPAQNNNTLAATLSLAEHSQHVNNGDACIPMKDIDPNIYTFSVSDPIQKIRDRMTSTDLEADGRPPVSGQPGDSVV